MAAAPSVELRFDPPGPTFAISEAGEMPRVTVTANLKNFEVDPTSPPRFDWLVTLVFTGGDACAHSQGRVTRHTPIRRSTTVNSLVIPFTEVRGGVLEVTVTAQTRAGALTGKSRGLSVVGTNPPIAVLGRAVAGLPAPGGVPAAFRKLMRVESGAGSRHGRGDPRQFRGPACPLFSGDNLGGVGLCQLTKPRPNDDEVWDWRANLRGGWALYQSKQRDARARPAQVRRGHAFKVLVEAYRAQRLATAAQHPSPAVPPAGRDQTTAAVPPVSYGHGAAPPASDHGAAGVPHRPLRPRGAGHPAGSGARGPRTTAPAAFRVDLPDYTAQQLEYETVRAFNGHAGGLYEYRVEVDRNGLLVVDPAPDGLSGVARWQRVSAADRIAFYDRKGISENHRGDPAYVDHVEREASF